MALGLANLAGNNRMAALGRREELVKLVADKDFGFGYRYDLILEDATVTVEGPST